MMEGVLWFESQLHDDFLPQYCVLDSFRGLRCTLGGDDSSSDNDGMWVFGGDVYVKQLGPEEPATASSSSDDGTIFYPFSLLLAKRVYSDDTISQHNEQEHEREHEYEHEHTIRLRLAATDAKLRLQWRNAFTDAAMFQDYLYACVECGAVPSVKLFHVLTSNQFRAVSLLKSRLAPADLGAMVMLCKMHQQECEATAAVEYGVGVILDGHVPLLAEMLSLMPNLTSLSIFQNQISDDSIMAILESTRLEQLVALDLSSNTMSDDGAERLASLLPKMQALRSLNLSNNFIGPAGCLALTRALTAYECLIADLNMAHNPIGDGAGELCAKLLLVRERERVRHISVAYCMVGDAGFQQIALALGSTIATSLEVLELGGNVPSTKGLLVLLRAIFDFHQEVPTCQLYLGGVAGASFSETLGAHVAKLPLVQMDTRTVLQKVILRRRRLLADSNSPAALIVLQMRCETPCRDVFETLRMLEETCSAAPGQIAVLAQSNALTRQQSPSLNHHILYLRALKAIAVAGKLAHKPREIAACVEELAAESHPNIAALDIARVYLPDVDGNSAGEHAPFRRRSAYRPLSQQLMLISSNQKEKINDEDEADDADLKPIAHLQMTIDIRPLMQKIEFLPVLVPWQQTAERRTTATIRHSLSTVQRRTTYSRRTSTAVPVEIAVVENGDGEGDDEDNAHEDVRTVTQEDETVTQYESVREDSVAETSNAVVEAVRQLVHTKAMTEDDAVIWYGLAGEQFAMPVLESLCQQAAVRAALFPNVQARATLCSSMFERNAPALVDCIKRVSLKGMEDDDLYYKAREVAERLLDALASYTILFAQADSSFPLLTLLDRLQDFLQQCAEVGLHGKEVFQAISLRERTAAIIQQSDDFPPQQFEMTQTRSYLSNVLISRDSNAARHALNWLSQDEQKVVRALGVPEEPQLRKFIEAFTAWSAQVDAVLVSPAQASMQEMLSALSTAAYIGVSDQRIDLLSQHIVQRASDLPLLLKRIVSAVEIGDAARVSQLLTEMKYCGVQVQAVQDFAQPILQQLRRMEVINEFELTVSQLGAKQKAGNLSADDIDTVLHAVYMADMFHIGIQQPARVQLAMLEREVIKLLSSEKNNQQLLLLLQNKDIEGLEVFLAGRGTGRLVACCQSDEELRRWTDAVSIAISQPHERGTLSFEGWLDKQSRGENSTIKNWRQRWLVLDGSYLSYSKEPKASARGTLYLPGGAIRRLDKHEDGGRRFGIEIIEGRDLSQVQPTLMQYAQRHIQRLIRDDLEQKLSKAIDQQNEVELLALTSRAKTESIKIDPAIATRAEFRVKQYLKASSKAQLEQACAIFSKRTLQVAIKAAQDSQVSESHPFFKKAHHLASLSEATLLLLHMQVCLRKGDYRLYNACVAAVKGFRSLADTEKAMLVASMIENAAKSIVIYDRKNGLRSRTTARTLRHAIDIAVSYGTEFASMQLGRLALQTRRVDEESLADVTLGGLDKFPRLALVNTTPRKGKQNFKKLDADSVLSFTTETLKHCLLRDLDDVQSELAIHSFEVLKSITASTVARSPKGVHNSGKLRYTNQEIGWVMELIETGTTQPAVRDELYVQALKQIQRNPSENARFRIWQLLALYLHIFPPSRLLSPYLCNQAVSLSAMEIPDHLDGDDLSTAARETSAGAAAEYVISTIRKGLESNWTSVQNRSPPRNLIECALQDHPLELQIDVPGHDALRLYIHVFEPISTWSVLKRLWWKLGGAEMEVDDGLDDASDAVSSRYQSMSGAHHAQNQVMDDETFIREKSAEHKSLQYLNYFTLCYHGRDKRLDQHNVEPLPWSCDLGWELLRRMTERTSSAANTPPDQPVEMIATAEKIQLQLRSHLPSRIAFGQAFVKSQKTFDKRFGEEILTDDMLYQWLRSTAQLHSTVSAADAMFVELHFAQCQLHLGAGMIDAYPTELGYVLGIQLCIKLGSSASDIDTELLRMTQLIKNPVVAVKVAQRAKETASSILAAINNEGLSVQSSRVHHLLKCAAMDYLQILPLFGSSRFEVHLHTPQIQMDGVLYVSCHSLHFLKTPSEMVFASRLADIESLTVKGNGMVIVINGFRLELLSENCQAIIQTISLACLTTLSTGAFERGSAQGNSGDDPYLQEIPTLLKSFLNVYPILPLPPLPQPIAQASEYFRFPPSTRVKAAKERLAQQRREVQNAIDTAARNAESDLKDMMQMRSNIQTDEDAESERGQSNPHVLTSGAVYGLSTRRMPYALPIVEEVAYTQKTVKLKRFNSTVDVVRNPLGFQSPAEPPEPPQATSVCHPSDIPKPLLHWPPIPLNIGVEEHKFDDGDSANANNAQPTTNWSYDAKTFLARSEFWLDVLDASADIELQTDLEFEETDYSGHALVARLEAAIQEQQEAKRRQEELRQQQLEEQERLLADEEAEFGSQHSPTSTLHRKSSLSTLKSFLRSDESRRDTMTRRSIMSMRPSQSN